MPQYTHFWFRDFIQPLWERFILPRRGTIKRYLEIGTCEGQSLIWVIQNLLTHDSDALAVDPYLPCRNWRAQEAKETKARMLANLDELYQGGKTSKPGWQFSWFGAIGSPLCRTHFVPLTSESFLYGAQKPISDFDMIYVDGDHNAPAAISDMIGAWRLLSPGGLMVVDDADRRWRQGRPFVHEAIQAFEMTHETLFDVVYRHQRQVCYVKRVGRRGRGQRPPMFIPVTPPGE